MDWRHRAACRDEDPELFFPVGNSGPALLQIAEAKAVCFRCPVASHCLSWALDTGQQGVWGGMSEDERHALKRRQVAARRAAHDAASDASEPDADGPADSTPSESAGLPVDVELCIAGRLERPGRDILLQAMRHLLGQGWTRTKVSRTLHINGTVTKELAELVAAEQMTEPTETTRDLVASAP